MQIPSSDRIRVLAGDDHLMILDGIASAVRAQADMHFAGEGVNGLEAIEQYRALRPEVLLLDLNMPVMNWVCPKKQ